LPIGSGGSMARLVELEENYNLKMRPRCRFAVYGKTVNHRLNCLLLAGGPLSLPLRLL
jgi:hypothetical protein